MADDSKQGPLSVADLLAVWKGSVDKTYRDPLILAGDGNGLEVHTQAFAQHARVSQAIDTSTQAMYIVGWSGQTAPPASGATLATVTLTFARTAFLNQPLRIGAGQVFVEERTTDWGVGGGLVVTTGRRYTLQQDLVFMPGESGPLTATAIAEFPGYGYNNPQPGTIRLIDQPGTAYFHDRGTITVAAGATPPVLPPPNVVVSLITVNEADTFVPTHIGQYVSLTAGANAGKIARISGFLPPNTSAIPPTGSTAILELLVVSESFGAVGTFTLGELVKVKAAGVVVGTGTFAAQRAGNAGHTRVAFVLTSGTVSTTNTLLGAISGATATVDLLLANLVFTPETPPPGGGAGGASWRVLDWVGDFGLTCTNVAQPTGGTSAMLDGLGADRGLPRNRAEIDSVYRDRIHKVADVVTPNAIRRALTRSLASLPWCFREVGSALLPGFYYDRTNDAGGDFYDYDTLLFTGALGGPAFIFQERVNFQDSMGNVKATGYFGGTSGGTLTMIRKSGQGTPQNPVVLAAGDVIFGVSSGATWTGLGNTPNPTIAGKRFHVYLDYTQFRAFFLVGVPRLDLGEFGFAYGVLPAGSPGSQFGAYDASPFPDFYDGFPAGDSAIYKHVWQELDRVRAGGTSFDLYLNDDGTCI